MAQLEYRILDEANGYPILYHYDSIPNEEVVARFLCDYLVKDGVVYEKTSNAVEALIFVIYVKISKEEKAILSNRHTKVGMGFIVMEVREFREDTNDYPILANLEFSNLTELALLAQCNYLMFDGLEWEQTSFEIDEDRQTYVLYVIKSH